MSATDIATLLTAIFAAVAAGASWVPVAQARKERIEARTPLMSIDLVAGAKSRELRVQITNHRGPARGVQFAVAVGDQWAYGTPPPTSVFLPGESRTLGDGHHHPGS